MLVSTGSQQLAERGYWQVNPAKRSLLTYDAREDARAAVSVSHNGTNWAAVDHLRGRGLARAVLTDERRRVAELSAHRRREAPRHVNVRGVQVG